ncbi:unnamed protein product [Notodromas monacha]|uniref:Uncharacterized protein n=1 Tax=Notodromas monacha TaxID=399045 RepID=A0A7R9G8U2_9CRUS|nr:unnamed protein product [Notodromas monacha]CAG0913625.1 unnamed protein product [Notodromas monacha]
MHFAGVTVFAICMFGFLLQEMSLQANAVRFPLRESEYDDFLDYLSDYSRDDSSESAEHFGDHHPQRWPGRNVDHHPEDWPGHNVDHHPEDWPGHNVDHHPEDWPGHDVHAAGEGSAGNKIGWLLTDSHETDCWKEAAKLALEGSKIEMVFARDSAANEIEKLSWELDLSRKFKILQKSGIKIFVGLEDHDSAKILLHQQNVKFVSPFATSPFVRGHPSVLGLSPSSFQISGTILSKTRHLSYSELLPVVSRGRKDVIDDLKNISAIFGFRLLEPIIIDDFEKLRDELVMRLWDNPNADIYFDSKPHFAPFLESLDSELGDPIASRTLYSPNALFFNYDAELVTRQVNNVTDVRLLKRRYETLTRMRTHSYAFLGGEDYASSVRRKLMSSLNSGDIDGKCSVTACLVFDAVLAARKLLENPEIDGEFQQQQKSDDSSTEMKFEGATGKVTISPKDSSASRTGKDLLLRVYAVDPGSYYAVSGTRLAQKSPWILDGTVASVDGSTKRNSTIPQQSVSPTNADTKTLFHDEKGIFNETFVGQEISSENVRTHSSVDIVDKASLVNRISQAISVGICSKSEASRVTVSFLVSDPLSYSKSQVNFSLDAVDDSPNSTFPVSVFVPIANGYEMRVTCGRVRLIVVCPGIDSKLNHRCLHDVEILPDTDSGDDSEIAARPRSKREVSRFLSDKIFLHAMRRQKALDDRRGQSKMMTRRISRFPSKARSSDRFQRRTDMYHQGSVYERIGKPPGYISRLLGYSAANILACMGKTAGCMVCISYRSAIDKSSVSCIAACASIGSTCSIAAGRVMAQYNVDNSVICTELFSQGRLDASSYLIDAGFGARLMETDPHVLMGYRALASPIVAGMQFSDSFTDIVENLAQPWFNYMRLAEGHATKNDAKDGENIVGRFFIRCGLVLCSVVGNCCSTLLAIHSAVSKMMAHFL